MTKPNGGADSFTSAFSDLFQNDRAEMKVRHPATREFVTDDSGEPWTFTFAGPSHEVTRASTIRYARARAEAVRELAFSEDRLRAEEIRLGRLLVAWRCLGFTTRNGISYSAETAEQIFCHPALEWLFRQADAFVGRDASFFSPPSTPAESTGAPGPEASKPPAPGPSTPT